MASNERRRREQQRRRVTAADARRRSARRRAQVVAILLAALLALSTLAGVLAATRGDDGSSPSTAPSSSTTSVPAAGTTPVPVEPGATLTGPTPCPAEDGSSPRTTSFAEPAPMCIDPGRFHTAVVTTSVGPLTFQLNPQRAPQATNAFVVLARYHFFDGQPVTHIEPRAWFEVGGLFTGDAPWGLPVPDDPGAPGQVVTPGTIALVGPPDGPGSRRGEVLVATLDRAPAVSDEATAFGILLDGAGTLAAVDRAASLDGRPTQPITIESVTVTAGPPTS